MVRLVCKPSLGASLEVELNKCRAPGLGGWVGVGVKLAGGIWWDPDGNRWDPATRAAATIIVVGLPTEIPVDPSRIPVK